MVLSEPDLSAGEVSALVPLCPRYYFPPRSTQLGSLLPGQAGIGNQARYRGCPPKPGTPCPFLWIQTPPLALMPGPLVDVTSPLRL